MKKRLVSFTLVFVMLLSTNIQALAIETVETEEKSGSGILAVYTITITDTFDFAYDNDYDDLFTTLVNNWAWLCQQTSVLNPIDIELVFLP